MHRVSSFFLFLGRSLTSTASRLNCPSSPPTRMYTPLPVAAALRSVSLSVSPSVGWSLYRSTSGPTPTNVSVPGIVRSHISAASPDSSATHTYDFCIYLDRLLLYIVSSPIHSTCRVNAPTILLHMNVVPVLSTSLLLGTRLSVSCLVLSCTHTRPVHRCPLPHPQKNPPPAVTPCQARLYYTTPP